MTSLDRPVWAPLLDFRQNQVRFRGFPCASADNADSRPTAAGRPLQMFAPGGRGDSSAARPCWPQQASAARHAGLGHLRGRPHTWPRPLGALRTRHIRELAGHAVLPHLLPGAPAPRIRLCRLHADRRTDSHGPGIAIFGNRARLQGPAGGTATCGYLLAGRQPYKGTHMPTPLRGKECRHLTWALTQPPPPARPAAGCGAETCRAQLRSLRLCSIGPYTAVCFKVGSVRVGPRPRQAGSGSRSEDEAGILHLTSPGASHAGRT